MKLNLANWVIVLFYLFHSALSFSSTQNTLSVAALPYLSSAPLYLAEIKSYYEAQGLDVTFHVKKSAQAVAEAVVSGEADIGVTGLTSWLLNRAESNDIRIIAGQYTEKKGNTGNRFIASNHAFNTGLVSVDRLKGTERFGMTTLGSTFHRWFGETVEKLGLPLAHFTLVPLNSVHAMRQALRDNHVDLVISSTLIAHNLMSAGKGHAIGKVADFAPGQLGVVFTKQATIEQDRQKIARFIQAYQQGCETYVNDLQKGPSSDFAKLIRQLNHYLRPQLDPAFAHQSLVYIASDASFNENDLKNTIHWFESEGFIQPIKHIEVLFDHSFLRKHPHTTSSQPTLMATRKPT